MQKVIVLKISISPAGMNAWLCANLKEKNPARTKLIAETYKYEDFEFILQLSKTINPLTVPVIRETLL